MKKVYFWVTVLLLIVMSVCLVWVSYVNEDYYPKVRSVFQGDGLRPEPNRDDPVLWASGILKIKVLGVNEQAKPVHGNISYKVRVIEDLKSNYSGVIELYGTYENFKKGGTYLVFMHKVDSVWEDRPYLEVMNEFQWDIKWGRLNNVPDIFREFSRYEKLKAWIKTSKNIGKYSDDQTPTIDKFKDIPEKIAASSIIVEVVVKKVEDNSRVLETAFEPSIKYFKGGPGEITAENWLFLFNRKYKIKNGDTLLLFMNKSGNLSAREGCLINKNDFEEWNQNFLQIKSD